MTDRPKVVLDTNIYLSTILFGGNPRKIISLAKSKKIEVFISPKILLEISDKLYGKFRWNEEQIKQVIRAIGKISSVVRPKVKLSVVKSYPTDDKIIECAMESEANFIITGDKHLLDIKKYKKIKILTPERFLNKVKF